MRYHSFCAANSGDGFISFFDTLLDEKNKKVYYLKGGPGSGKSTFLKEVSRKSADAELIHCSGDPQSLDGIILPKLNAVIIDATAPHSHEPQYPGIGGEIIDFGMIWQAEKINKDRIIELSEQKQGIYQSSYNLLKAIKGIYKGIYQPLQSNVISTKIKGCGDKILKHYALWEHRSVTAQIDKRFLSAISPNGLITYSDTFSRLSKHTIVLDDRWSIADTLLVYLDRQLTARGIDHLNAYHPLLGKDHLQHIIIPSASLSICSKDGIFPLDLNEQSIVKVVSVQNFVPKEVIQENRNKLIFMKRLIKELLKTVTEQFENARTIHLGIEAEYSKGANYEKASFIKEKFINKIFP